MTLRTGFILAGIAAILAGISRIAAAWPLGVSEAVGPDLFYFFIDAAFLFGTVGLYTRHAEAMGLLGLAGFVPALFGVALILGPDVPFMGVDLYALGSTLFAVGMAIQSGAALIFRVPFWGAQFFLGALALGVAAQFVPGVPWHTQVTGTLFALGFVAGGAQLLRKD